MSNYKTIKLEGRVFLTFDIVAVTGMHIGGSDTGIEIGGVDKTVIRDPLTNRPYIPGSSLKGKMRSLLEKYNGLVQNQKIGQGYIHTCQNNGSYNNCDVCQVFGVPGEHDFGTPTRLLVRDVLMNDDEAKRIDDKAKTDLPYTEIKTEVSIDRVTSAANPRQLERVPAGTKFGRGEMVYSIYNGDDCNSEMDVKRLATVAAGLRLLEDDYLGGHGSRGSGKVQLQDIKVTVRSQKDYLAEPIVLGSYDDVTGLTTALVQLQDDLKKQLGIN